jgi:restriction system protein
MQKQKWECIKMAVPDFQTIMLPLLKLLKDNNEHSLREVIDLLAVEFHLSEVERKELLPSGKQPKFDNRVGWARIYLKKAGLLDTPRRGYYLVTQRGLSVLKSNPTKIDVTFLDQYSEFKAFKNFKARNENDSKPVDVFAETNPEEAFAEAYQRLKNEVTDDLLQQLKESTPTQFEKIVVDLVVAMGYGGSYDDAAKAIGKRGDEGVDGIINEDRLGLDVIYIQAKKWDGTVGRPEIQKFAGALQGQRAKKGIFVTTSDFSKEAYDYASRIDSKVILLDGVKIAQYMFDRNVGVSISAVYEIKKIDNDYFVDM